MYYYYYYQRSFYYVKALTNGLNHAKFIYDVLIFP